MLNHMPTCVLVVIAVFHGKIWIAGEHACILWFRAHSAYLKNSAFEISRLGLHRNIQTETRKGTANNAAREPEKLRDVSMAGMAFLRSTEW